ALSLLGGTFRLGMFVGPFISAALLGIFGDESASIAFFAVCQVATILLVFLGPDPERLVPATATSSAVAPAAAPSLDEE
ncbi:hypothetical protein ACMWQA_27255, partial [Escherichia coli]